MNSFRGLPQNVPSAVSNRSGKLSRRTSFRGDSTTTPAAWLPATHAAALLPAASDFATDVVSWGRLSCAAFSMRGRTHTENEDAFYVAPEHGIFALADGVSGLKTGARASGLAVLTATEYLRRQLTEGGELLAAQSSTVFVWLEGAVRAAHQALLMAAEERGKPMCCTLDLVLVQGERAYLAHVGDSRVYHQTGGMMSALTCDHTLAQKLAELGLGEIEALNTRWQHVLSMAIGSQNGVEPQILSVGLLPGDRLLLCSDGVHGELADDSIQRLLVGAPAMAGWSLVKRVSDLEGSDDATLVVIEKQ